MQCFLIITHTTSRPAVDYWRLLPVVVYQRCLGFQAMVRFELVLLVDLSSAFTIKWFCWVSMGLCWRRRMRIICPQSSGNCTCWAFDLSTCLIIWPRGCALPSLILLCSRDCTVGFFKSISSILLTVVLYLSRNVMVSLKLFRCHSLSGFARYRFDISNAVQEQPPHKFSILWSRFTQY